MACASSGVIAAWAGDAVDCHAPAHATYHPAQQHSQRQHCGRQSAGSVIPAIHGPYVLTGSGKASGCSGESVGSRIRYEPQGKFCC